MMPSRLMLDLTSMDIKLYRGRHRMRHRLRHMMWSEMMVALTSIGIPWPELYRYSLKDI